MSPTKSSKRSANTCAECRARKVRCEGNRPVCSHCDRLGLDCSFQRADRPESEAVQWERRRVRLACASCHALKARCTGQLPKCQRCQAKGIDCVYAPSKRASHNPSSFSLSDHPSTPDTAAYSDASPSGHPRLSLPPYSSQRGHNASSPTTCGTRLTSMPDESLVMKALDSFFKHIFPIPVFSFLHKPSIIQRYQSGLLDRALTLAIVGITSQLTDLGTDMRAYGDKCVAASESRVLRDVGRPSVIKIQCLILIIEHHLLRRDFTTAFTLHALACRFAFALRLNHEAPKLCFLAQESRRRLIWSLYTLDCYLSGGMTELTLCSAESLHIQLPCQERNFEFDLEQQTEPLQPRPHQLVSDSVGSLGLYLRILYLHEKVLRCTKEMVMTQAAEGSVEQFPRIVEALAGELDDYAASLPPSFHFSEKNLHLRAYSPRLCPFILIHIWCRQCYCDLFKFTTPGLRVALTPESLARLNPDFVAYCRWQCFENARALADAFRSLIALRRPLPVMDTQVHLSAYQCARLLYYCYRNHADALSLTADAVNDYARQCLEVLERLPNRTLTGDSIQEDLRKLIERGISVGSTPSSPNSSERDDAQDEVLLSSQTVIPPKSNQLFSTHGVVNQMEILDDSEVLTMPSTTTAPAPLSTSELMHSGQQLDLLPPADTSPMLGLDEAGGAPNTEVFGADETDAFQGALDEFAYNPSSIAVDPFNWFSSQWNPGDFGRSQPWT